MENSSSQAALAKIREMVARHLSENFDRIKKAASPLPPSTDAAALRAGIVESVAWCLFLHMLSPLRRYADNRRALLQVRKHTETSTAALQALSASLGELFPWSGDLLREHFKLATGEDLNGLLTTIEQLAELAPIAARHADLLRASDKGGRPKMMAFELLIRGLAEAYEKATGRVATVTYDPHRDRHSGPFVRLVNAVLPIVKFVVGGRPLEQPASDYARGQLIREVLRRSRKAENLIVRRSG